MGSVKFLCGHVLSHFSLKMIPLLVSVTFGKLLRVQVTQLSRTVASSPISECINSRQQEHVDSKTLVVRKFLVFNWGCRLILAILLAVTSIQQYAE